MRNEPEGASPPGDSSTPPLKQWYDHIMDNHIICGGFFTQSSCLYYRGGEWTQYKNDLKIKRSDHVSWRSPDGKVLLIGGDGDPTKKSQKYR